MSCADLHRRWALVREVLRLSPDPLDELGLDFTPIDPNRHVESWSRFIQAAARRTIPDELIVYVHVPFCARLCSYCLLATRAAPPRARIAAYVSALRKEIASHAELLRTVEVSALHVGGGTPTLLDTAELDALLADLGRVLRKKPGFRSGIEGHPATTTPEKVAVLARHGVQRISLGVESFTSEVLRGINRSDQSEARVAAAVEAARRHSLRVNLDMLAGLPGETLDSFETSLRKALALCPDSLSVNRWLAEKSALAATGVVPDVEEAALAGEMLRLADRVVREVRPPSEPREPSSGAYGTQYGWGSGADGYYQQDMIGPASILALGHGGMGHVYAGYFYTAAGGPDEWVEAIERGAAPAVLAAPVSRRFELAFALVERAYRGRLELPAFAREQHVEPRGMFTDELEFLEAAGLLSSSARRSAQPNDGDATELLLFLLSTEQALQARAEQLRDAARPLLPVLRQYRDVPGGLPPSVLWCRIAMRADAQARAQAAGERG